MPEDYVIGIDGGGTRSQGLAFGLNGEVLCRADGGALNFYTTTCAEFASNVQGLCQRLRAGLSERRCLRTVIGTAALFERASDHEYQSALGIVDLSGLGEVSLVGDALTAVVGATGGREGVLLISGTGSIAIRRTQSSETFFSGGLGPALGGDPGSAFWMAGRVLQQVQRDSCRSGEIGGLGRFVFESLGVDSLAAAITECYTSSDSQKRFAGLARLLSECSDREVAGPWRTIERKAGEALAELLFPLLERDEGVVPELYIAGSVLLENARVRASLSEVLSNRFGTAIALRAPRYNAAEGALILALQECRLPFDTLIRRGLIERNE